MGKSLGPLLGIDIALGPRDMNNSPTAKREQMFGNRARAGGIVEMDAGKFRRAAAHIEECGPSRQGPSRRRASTSCWS